MTTTANASGTTWSRRAFLGSTLAATMALAASSAAPARARESSGGTAAPTGGRRPLPFNPRTAKPGTITMAESMAHNFTLPLSTDIVGVDNTAQLEEDLRCAASFVPLSVGQMLALEKRALPIVRQGLYFRRWDLGA